MALLNVAGYFDPLLAFLDRAVHEGFLRREHHALLIHGDDIKGEHEVGGYSRVTPYSFMTSVVSREFASLDVPASEVRHPVVYGPIGRSRPGAGGMRCSIRYAAQHSATEMAQDLAEAIGSAEPTYPT